MEDHCRLLLEDFLKNSFSTIKVLVENLATFKAQHPNRKVTLFHYVDGKKVKVNFDGDHFFIRASFEYANPQLTLEEAQGIVATRLLETCGNYFLEYGVCEPDKRHVDDLYEALKKPPSGYIVPFMLNTDDVEPDRYSLNPLRKSIVDSGQSAFPAAYVKTDELKIDKEFVKKYDGKLTTQKEVDLIDSSLKNGNGSYLDMVDSVKYAQIKELTAFCGMNLSLYSLRMPLSMLQTEKKDGPLHYIISESHRDYEAIEQAYTCMNRSLSKRTTLLTVPHSKKGYGSKRAVRGKLHFKDEQLENVTVNYKTTKLYPNGVNPADVSFAVCDDSFSVSAEQLSDYSYLETPSSPQFFLYSIASPEDASVWHGVGVFGSPKLLQSCSSARAASREGKFIRDLNKKYNFSAKMPLQFNLVPEGMWRHPVHNNIDASVGSVEKLCNLAKKGMRVEYLSEFE